jgi:hypothetical protein
MADERLTSHPVRVSRILSVPERKALEASAETLKGYITALNISETTHV